MKTSTWILTCQDQALRWIKKAKSRTICYRHTYKLSKQELLKKLKSFHRLKDKNLLSFLWRIRSYSILCSTRCSRTITIQRSVNRCCSRKWLCQRLPSTLAVLSSFTLMIHWSCSRDPPNCEELTNKARLSQSMDECLSRLIARAFQGHKVKRCQISTRRLKHKLMDQDSQSNIWTCKS